MSTADQPQLRVQSHYLLHGLRIQVVAGDEELERAARRLLTQSGLSTAEGDWARADVRIELAASGRDLEIPPAAREVARHLEIRVLRNGDTVYLDDGGSRGRLDPQGGVLELSLAPEVRRAPSWSRANLVVLYGLMTLLRYRGIFALHAAGAAVGDAGCLIAATRGGGKSTLALALVRQGWGLLSDDSVLLRSVEGVVEALPLRGDLLLKGLDPEAPVGECWESEWVGEAHRYRLRLGETYPDRLVRRCQPRVLLFPTVVEAASSRVARISDHKALFLLLEHSTIVDLEPTMAQAHVSLLRDLVKQCRCLRLRSGRDVQGDPGAVSELLRDLLAGPDLGQGAGA